MESYTITVYGYDVEPDLGTRGDHLGKIRRQKAQSRPFPMIDRSKGRPEGPLVPAFHLDKHEAAPFDRHEIDLPARKTHVSGDDPVPTRR